MNQEFPPGWDEERVRKVIEYYENQTEEEAIAEAEAAYADPDSVVVVLPKELMPAVNKLLAEYEEKLEAEQQKKARSRKAKR
jgi:hypothetical protein